MGRIIHTGDTHIGYLQYHLPSRQSDFLNAFKRVVQDAIDGDFDAIVHSGDLFDKINPDLKDIAGTIEILQLAKGKVPILAIAGNHEMRRGGIQWIDLFDRLGLVKHLDESPYIIKDQEGDIAIYGMDYVHQDKREELDYQFEDSQSKYKILVSHGQFTPLVLVPGRNAWDLEMVLESSNIKFDVVLLGDEHGQKQKMIGDVWATYCGSTERASIKERERRSYNIIDLKDGINISTRNIQTREFVYIEEEITEQDGIGYLYDRIKEEEHKFVDAVVIITVENKGRKIPISEIEEYCKQRGAIYVQIKSKVGEEGETRVGEWVSFEDPSEAIESGIEALGLTDISRQIDLIVRDQNILDSNLKIHVKELIEEFRNGMKGLEEPGVEDNDKNGKSEEYTLGDFS
tara:strand:- start:18520 stop:19725 length:1206 start_codon:yes stop_codon:yes gene_type:complete